MARYHEIEKLKEEERLKTQKYEITLNASKSFEKTFQQVINVIFSKGGMKEDLGHVHKNFKEIRIALIGLDKEEKENCYNLLIFMHKQKMHKILEDEKFIIAILNIMKLNLFWIRKFNEWERNSYNPEKQLYSLIRYLFCKYEVPTFMDSVWLKNFATHIDWFIHVGEGKNLKDLKSFPKSFTKKMIHIFVNTPSHYSVQEAISRAQIISLGGDESLVHSIISSKIGTQVLFNDFWKSVIEYFARITMLNQDLIAPIIDYIDNQRHGARQGYIRPHVWGTIPPPQPGFSMKGRTIDKLIEDTEVWHSQISKQKKGGMAYWSPSGIKSFEMHEGKQGEKNFKVYTIQELTTAKQLAAEGGAMRHCVFSYVGSCVKGHCSIWSLSLFASNKPERLVTIEVRQGVIMQIKAKNNGKPTQKDMFVIKKWAAEAGIILAKYYI